MTTALQQPDHYAKPPSRRSAAAGFCRVWTALVALSGLLATVSLSVRNTLISTKGFGFMGGNDEQLLLMWANNATNNMGMEDILSSLSPFVRNDNDSSIVSYNNKLLDMLGINGSVENDTSRESLQFPPPVQYGMNQSDAGEIGCCGMKKWRDKPDICKLTCFTKHACTETKDFPDVFPFSSMEEQQWFSQSANGTNAETMSYQQCRKWPKEHPTLPDKPTWCPNDETQQPNWVELFWSGCHVSPFDRMLIFPQGKLALCGIPKVGVTQWQKFLRYTIGAQDYESLPYYKQDLFPLVFHRLPADRQREILQDPSWTKAIFLRHPGERVLSAFLDKVKSKSSNPYQNYSFAEWLHLIQTGLPNQRMQGCNQVGPSWCMDPHWRPQYYSCGIHELLPYYDFVGSMDYAARDTKRLLEKVGLWDRYGKTYLSSVSPFGSTCGKLPPDPESRPVYTGGFQQNVEARTDRHTHNSKSKLKDHMTPGVVDMLEQMYAQDYRLWEELEQLQQEPRSSNWTHGATLAHRLNPTCPSHKPRVSE